MYIQCTCKCENIHTSILTQCVYILNSSPGSPSFRAIISPMTFDPPERKAEGSFGQVKGHTRNYYAEGGRAWGQGYVMYMWSEQD